MPLFPFHIRHIEASQKGGILCSRSSQGSKMQGWTSSKAQLPSLLEYRSTATPWPRTACRPPSHTPTLWPTVTSPPSTNTTPECRWKEISDGKTESRLNVCELRKTGTVSIFPFVSLVQGGGKQSLVPGSLASPGRWCDFSSNCYQAGQRHRAGCWTNRGRGCRVVLVPIRTLVFHWRQRFLPFVHWCILNTQNTARHIVGTQ